MTDQSEIKNKRFSLKCSRCGCWHQRLVRIWDNIKDAEQFECLDCLAELLGGRFESARQRLEYEEK